MILSEKLLCFSLHVYVNIHIILYIVLLYVVFTYTSVVKALLKTLNGHQKVQTQKDSVRSFRVMAVGPPEDENACPRQYCVMCN